MVTLLSACCIAPIELHPRVRALLESGRDVVMFPTYWRCSECRS